MAVNAHSRKLVCKECFGSLRFSQDHKNVPLDYETRKPRVCRVSRPTQCNACGILEYFDDRNRSRNEVLIPIEYETEDHHVCSNKPRAKRNSKPMEALQ